MLHKYFKVPGIQKIKNDNHNYDFRRETPNDVVVIKNESPNAKTWEQISQTEGSVIGTSSVRR